MCSYVLCNGMKGFVMFEARVEVCNSRYDHVGGGKKNDGGVDLVYRGLARMFLEKF